MTKTTILFTLKKKRIKENIVEHHINIGTHT